jgi:hypothetical protein
MASSCADTTIRHERRKSLRHKAKSIEVRGRKAHISEGRARSLR